MIKHSHNLNFNKLIQATLIALVLFIPISAFSYGGIELFKKFPNKYFVETGTYNGLGVKHAIQTKCFQIIHSIELSPTLYANVNQQFANFPNVILWEGDSGVLLREVLNTIDAPATIWLDAHYSGGSTVKGDTMSPILKELDCIKSHHIKSHTILIDDVRQFGTEHFDYVTYEKIASTLLEINPRYKLSLVDCDFAKKDVLVAYLPK